MYIYIYIYIYMCVCLKAQYLKISDRYFSNEKPVSVKSESFFQQENHALFLRYVKCLPL